MAAATSRVPSPNGEINDDADDHYIKRVPRAMKKVGLQFVRAQRVLEVRDLIHNMQTCTEMQTCPRIVEAGLHCAKVLAKAMMVKHLQAQHLNQGFVLLRVLPPPLERYLHSR